MQGKKILSLPGGATKGAGIAGAAYVVVHEFGFVPDAIVGVSYGALAAVPVALGMWDELLAESKQLNLRKIFTVSPTTPKGKISWAAIWRAIRGETSLGVQDIKPILRKVITPERFKEYQNGPYAECYVLACEYKKRKAVLWNLKDPAVTYEKYLAYVQASALIPIATQAETIDGVDYYDGGLIDHNGGARLCRLLESQGVQIDWLVSIYPRPEKFDVPPLPEPKNVLDVALGVIDIQKVEISLNDQADEIAYLREHYQSKNYFQLTQIFLPWVLDHLYDVDNDALEYLQEQSMNATRRQLMINK